MTADAQRRARMQRECEVSALPALLLLAACAAFAVSAEAADGTDVASPAFDAAMVAYERNHWDEAYAAFTRLADGGHPEAARIAWQMWRYGPTLYRTDFNASVRQVELWSRLWGCGGDATSLPCQWAMKAP